MDLLILVILVTTRLRSFGYSMEGHKAVAEIARSLLDPKARAAVVRILGNDDLAAVATWPDATSAPIVHNEGSDKALHRGFIEGINTEIRKGVTSSGKPSRLLS